MSKKWLSIFALFGILISSSGYADDDECRGWPENNLADANDCRTGYANGSIGVWLPEDPLLFKPFIADPRQVTYSIGWRFSDRALGKNIVDVSFGDYLPIYEWWDVWPGHGQMRIDLEGGLWAVFAPMRDNAPLINADYYVGLLATYAKGPLSFRARFYHISSHLGDEFLLDRNNKHICRKNPSAENFDFFASYYLTDDIRIYGGLGAVLHQDDSFRCGKYFGAAGMELYVNELVYIDYTDRLYGVPFYGMYFRFNKDFKHHVDATYVLGYEWGKFHGLCRKLRIFLEYHDGYSLEGQFCKYPTNYLSIRASYGF